MKQNTAFMNYYNTYCWKQNFAFFLRDELNRLVDSTLLLAFVEGAETAHDRHISTRTWLKEQNS